MTASAEMAKALKEIASELKKIRFAMAASAGRDGVWDEILAKYIDKNRPDSDGEGSENE